MILRDWQASCINNALSKYNSGCKHFLALATPGAGKTVMAGCLARALIDAKKIDFVLCFAPTL